MYQPPHSYPKRMRHRESYAANNCPECLAYDLQHDRHARERYVDLDTHGGVCKATNRVVLMAVHWKITGKNGFTHILTEDGELRRLTKGERNSDLTKWDAAKVLRLRTPPERGGHRHRPMLLTEAIKICAQYGAVANPEFKLGNPYNLRVRPWRIVKKYAGVCEVRLVVKVLPMQGWLRACATVSRAGIRAAVIGGGRDDWGPPPRRQPSYVYAYWGPPGWRR